MLFLVPITAAGCQVLLPLVLLLLAVATLAAAAVVYIAGACLAIWVEQKLCMSCVTLSCHVSP